MATTTLSRPEGRTEIARYPLGRLFDRDLRWMRQMTRDMDRLFGDFALRPFAWEGAPADLTWMPELEVFERDGRFIVRADLPGMKKDDVKVNLQENMLTMEGERKVEEEVKKDGFHRTERSYGTFFRSIALPEGAMLDKVDATFKDGVLEIAIPMQEVKKPGRAREVNIK